MAKKNDLLNHLDRLKRLETERRAADESAYEGCALAEADGRDWPTSAEEFVLVLSRLGRSVDEFSAIVESVRRFRVDAESHDRQAAERDQARAKIPGLLKEIEADEKALNEKRASLQALRYVGDSVPHEFQRIRGTYRAAPVVSKLYFTWQSGNPNA